MNLPFRHRILFVIFLLLTITAQAQQNSTIDFPQLRFKNLKKYVSADLFYTHDFISNTGGIKSGPRNIGALDIYLASDLSRFSSVQGEFMAHYIHINQNDSRGNIGDLQTASNIDMPTQVDRMVDLWYQQNWNDQFKTLFGLHDISMEFNVSDSSLLFLNSSFGTSAEFALAGPSIYPLTSLGLRAHYQFNNELSLKTGLYDAQVGDEKTYRSFHSDIGQHEGFMHISELAYQQVNQKMALGGWNFSRPQKKLSDDNTAPLLGAYGLYERELLTKMWIFVRYGWANPQVSAIQSNSATGLIYRGIMQKKRVYDEVGLGLSQIHFSTPYLKEITLEEESKTSPEETAYELYYHFKPIKYLSFRPDIQYIENPSGIDNIKNAWAFGFRSVVEI